MRRAYWSLLYVTALQLSAQEAAHSSAWLRHLKPGAMLRFHVVGQGLLAGPLRRLGADSVVVGPAFGYSPTDTAVALASVDSAWALEPQIERGVLVGAVAGTVFGLAIGSQQLNLCPSSPTSHGACIGNVGAGGLIGLSIGAALGWAIGSSDFHWVRRMP